MNLAAPKTIALLAIPWGIMAGIIMPGAGADLEQLSGGFGPLDLQLYYTPSTAALYLEAYGAMGRPLYLFLELTADVAYPIFYTLFLWALLLFLMKKAPAEPFRWAWLLPLFVLGFDFLENIMLCLLLVFYPKDLVIIAGIAGIFTFLKWLSFAVVLSFILYLTFLVFYSKKRPIAKAF